MIYRSGYLYPRRSAQSEQILAGGPGQHRRAGLGTETEKRGVLYISQEDTFQRIQKRLDDVSGGSPVPIWLATEAMCIGGGFEEQLVNFLTAHPSVKLVIIDTFQRVRKARSGRLRGQSDGTPSASSL
ncbi:MAG: AAA family ATPase [Lachnospiraceae bacterium]|nr:AAA family ATPase [Lachnospiraceae bacterium]MCM1215619.1 AAA family ATPase [Lachnospiraceae bacterium]